MEKNIKIQGHDLNLFYGQNHALHNVSLDIKEKCVTALIGPSGCGKSTFLKCLNRMNDLVDNVRIEGEILLDGEDIYAPSVDTTVLRKKVGMVFQQPNPFPMSIYDNIAYGPRVHGIKDKRTLDQIVEESLKGAAIFDEVKDRLKKSALGLSGGQQSFHQLQGRQNSVSGGGVLRENNMSRLLTPDYTSGLQHSFQYIPVSDPGHIDRDPVGLHRLQVRGQHLLGDPLQRPLQLAEALRAREQIPQDQHLPAVRDQHQRCLHRAVRQFLLFHMPPTPFYRQFN